MRNSIFVLMLATCACSQMPVIEPGVSHELAKWRAAHYSDVRYNLNLTLEKMSPVLKGTMEIRVKVGPRTLLSATPQSGVSGSEPPALAGGLNWSGGSTPIVLDWRKIRGSETLSTISNVSVNGSAVVLSTDLSRLSADAGPAKAGTQNEYYESNEHLIFRDSVVEGENVIKLDFTSPILTSGSAITRYVDKEDGSEYIYSLFVPSDASTAFPVFDQPDLKARFTLRIEIPWYWRAVSNAPLEEFSGAPNKPNDNDLAYFKFPETKPISTYVFAFAAGPFNRFEEVSRFPGLMRSELCEPKLGDDESRICSRIYVRKSQAAKFKPHSAEVFRLNREGIKYLEQYFDYKFPFPKYDIVLIPEFPFGGMEHAGATFLREASVIFPTEPTANDYISRANLIFHEAAHQWFGDTVTMKWFDDLWLKEGFAEFMAYKTLEKVMPEYNAWKVFYERNKQAAYLTDSTKGTTPIYQPISNLSAAKSAYGNIVYRKAPSFLKQAQFYIGPDKFQTAVRSFLKKHEFANAGWEDLVKEFETAGGQLLNEWARVWIAQPGLPLIVYSRTARDSPLDQFTFDGERSDHMRRLPEAYKQWSQSFEVLVSYENGSKKIVPLRTKSEQGHATVVLLSNDGKVVGSSPISAILPNYQDYGYGIFLLDDKSREYVLKNIQNEKDDFLRSMMWGSLWDSVREAELDPKDYVELVISVLSTDFSRPTVGKKPAKAGKKPPKGGTQSGGTQSGGTRNDGSEDESTIQTLLGRVATAINYYVSDAQVADLAPRFEAMLLDRLQKAATPGQRITFFRAFVSNAVTERGRQALKQMIADSAPTKAGGGKPLLPLKPKDRFDIVTRLAILGDPDAAKLLAELEKTETSDEAKRYAFAARAGFANAENKAKYWNDFVNNREISESWIESAFIPFNSIRHSALTQPYLERALAELPNLKRTRKIFFINGWLNAFIGGQRDEASLAIINKFLNDNPNLDNDLRLKILENSDIIERAIKIRAKYK